MKRFIEVSFPVKEVSEESAREKNIRHGHISTLHIWWARRPLASSRATSYAALIPAPEDDLEWDKTRQFIINLSKWENSLNPHLIEKARKDILEANGGKTLKVLDPFAGGGAIPLEALRLGCETYACEYNPVAVLILKCTLEYPQKYGRDSGFGIGNWKEKTGGIEYEKLQGTRGLAEGNKSSGNNIQTDQNITSRGTIRTDISDSASGSFCSSEYSGGMGKGLDKGIHPVSIDSQKFSDGIGDTSHHSKEGELHQTSRTGKSSKGNRAYRDDAQSPGAKSEERLNMFPNSEIRTPNPLLYDVKKWGKWVLEEAKKEIGKFYPEDNDGSIPVGYIWARTIPCQNPSCGAEIPLMRQFWLAKKPGGRDSGLGVRHSRAEIRGKFVALYPFISKKRVDFAIIQKTKNGWKIVQSSIPNPEPRIPKDFDPSKGTVKGAVARCLVCGSTVDANTARRLFQEGKAGQRMVAVVLHHPKKQGKIYRIAIDKDLNIFKEAEEYLEKKRAKLMEECLPAPRHREGKWYVYVLRCADGSLYKGFTGNLEKRLKEHQEKKVTWTSTRLPVKLVYYEIFDNEKDAIKREKELKTGFGRKWLEKKLAEMARQAGGIDPVPDEEIHTPDGKEYKPGNLLYNFTPVVLYGMTKWGDLFNPRQKLALITFVEKVRLTYERIRNWELGIRNWGTGESDEELQHSDKESDQPLPPNPQPPIPNPQSLTEEYAKAVVGYLGLMLGKLVDWNSVLSVWRPDQERNEHVFNRQALPMVWDYGERNPFDGNLMTPKGIDNIISHLSQIPPVEPREEKT